MAPVLYQSLPSWGRRADNDEDSTSPSAPGEQASNSNNDPVVSSTAQPDVPSSSSDAPVISSTPEPKPASSTASPSATVETTNATAEPSSSLIAATVSSSSDIPKPSTAVLPTPSTSDAPKPSPPAPTVAPPQPTSAPAPAPTAPAESPSIEAQPEPSQAATPSVPAPAPASPSVPAPAPASPSPAAPESSEPAKPSAPAPDTPQTIAPAESSAPAPDAPKTTQPAQPSAPAPDATSTATPAEPSAATPDAPITTKAAEPSAPGTTRPVQPSAAAPDAPTTTKDEVPTAVPSPPVPSSAAPQPSPPAASSSEDSAPALTITLAPPPAVSSSAPGASAAAPPPPPVSASGKPRASASAPGAPPASNTSVPASESGSARPSAGNNGAPGPGPVSSQAIPSVITVPTTVRTSVTSTVTDKAGSASVTVVPVSSVVSQTYEILTDTSVLPGPQVTIPVVVAKPTVINVGSETITSTVSSTSSIVVRPVGDFAQHQSAAPSSGVTTITDEATIPDATSVFATTETINGVTTSFSVTSTHFSTSKTTRTSTFGPNPTLRSQSNSANSGMRASMIAGAVVGSIALAILLGLCGLILFRRRRLHRLEDEASRPPSQVGSVRVTPLTDEEIMSWRPDRGGKRGPLTRVTSTLFRISDPFKRGSVSTVATGAGAGLGRQASFATNRSVIDIPAVPKLPEGIAGARTAQGRSGGPGLTAPRLDTDLERQASLTSSEIASWRLATPVETPVRGSGASQDPFRDASESEKAAEDAANPFRDQAAEVDKSWQPPRSRMRVRRRSNADEAADPFSDAAIQQAEERSRLSTASGEAHGVVSPIVAL